MIKTHHSLLELDKMASVFSKEINRELEIKSKLSKWPNDDMKPVMDYLLQILSKILTGRPDVLESEIVPIQQRVDQAIVDYRPKVIFPLNKAKKPMTAHQQDAFLKKWAGDAIRSVFDYNKFTSLQNGALAYRHSKRLNTNTCPYCNCNFTFTMKNKRAKTRPQFDHFLSKGAYPFFAVSFYNLIPSCPTCNSTGVKGEKPFSHETHLHPFIHEMRDLYHFRTKVKAVDFIVDKNLFDLKLEPCKGAKPKEKLRATNSIKDFALNDRYKFHKDYAGEIILKAYIYKVEDLEKDFSSFKDGKGDPIFKSSAEIKELIIGNYLDEGKLHKRILSKLAKDIAEEFGLTI